MIFHQAILRSAFQSWQVLLVQLRWNMEQEKKS